MLIVRLNWLKLCQVFRMAVVWDRYYCLLYTSQLSFRWSNFFSTFLAIVPSPGVRVAVAESLNGDLKNDSE